MWQSNVAAAKLPTASTNDQEMNMVAINRRLRLYCSTMTPRSQATPAPRFGGLNNVETFTDPNAFLRRAAVVVPTSR
jgi:hypothetical protein